MPSCQWPWRDLGQASAAGDHGCKRSVNTGRFIDSNLPAEWADAGCKRSRNFAETIARFRPESNGKFTDGILPAPHCLKGPRCSPRLPRNSPSAPVKRDVKVARRSSRTALLYRRSRRRKVLNQHAKVQYDTAVLYRPVLDKGVGTA